VATLIRDQDNAARHPFTIVNPQGGFLVPAGEEYVIQNVFVRLSGASGFNAVEITGTCISAGVQADFFDATLPAPAVSPTQVNVYQSIPITAYCDPNPNNAVTDSMEIYYIGVLPSFSPGTITVTITGYWVSLP
jgi:hypothetical protein